MLPFMDKVVPVLQVLVTKVLLLQNVLLLLGIPVVSLVKLLQVFIGLFDPEMLLTIVMDLIEFLLALVLYLLGLVLQVFNLLGWLVLTLWSFLYVFHGAFSMLKHIQHVISGQSLNHTHELLYAGCDAFTIKNGHEIADERLLVRQCDECLHAHILKLLVHLFWLFLN